MLQQMPFRLIPSSQLLPFLEDSPHHRMDLKPCCAMSLPLNPDLWHLLGVDS